MLKHFLIAFLFCFPAIIRGAEVDPMTTAVLNAYSENLRSDPNDYVTYYQRALQYYRLQMLDQAADDVEQALRLTPDKDKELKAREYELKAGIQALKTNYSEAVLNISKALNVNPGNYEMTYRLGEFSLLANDYESAKEAFIAMQRVHPHSPEAMLGLAKIDIAQGNVNEGLAKMKRAEELNSSLWTTQQSIGDLLVTLNQPQQAAISYIKAIALADGQSMPLESLFKLARNNYTDVKEALTEAASKSPNSIAMPLLMANIAFETGHYRDAEAYLNTVLRFEQGKQPSVYSLLAESMLRLNRCEEAVILAVKVVNMDSQPGYLIKLAHVQRCSGDAAAALNNSRKVTTVNPKNEEALMEEAKSLIALGRHPEAIEVLERIITINPDNGLALYLNAVCHDKTKDNQAGLYYNRCAKIQSSDPALTCIKIISQSKSGKILDADASLRELLRNPGPEEYYWGAVASAHLGDSERSSDLIKKAKESGFENFYLLEKASGPLTLRP